LAPRVRPPAIDETVSGPPDPARVLRSSRDIPELPGRADAVRSGCRNPALVAELAGPIVPPAVGVAGGGAPASAGTGVVPPRDDLDDLLVLRDGARCVRVASRAPELPVIVAAPAQDPVRVARHGAGVILPGRDPGELLIAVHRRRLGQVRDRGV